MTQQVEVKLTLNLEVDAEKSKAEIKDYIERILDDPNLQAFDNNRDEDYDIRSYNTDSVREDAEIYGNI
jgi:hypothetical protein